MEKLNGKRKEKQNSRRRRVFLSIPLNEKLLNFILSKKKINGITESNVTLDSNLVSVSGKVNKLLLKFDFKISLIPSDNTDGMLRFKIVELKPVKIHWLTNKYLDRPPIKALNDILIIDLNHPSISNYFTNKIVGIKITKKNLWCQFGL